MSVVPAVIPVVVVVTVGVRGLFSPDIERAHERG
jgi:hypothetical protein